MKKSDCAAVTFLLMLLVFTSPVSAEDFYAGDVISLGGSSPSNYVYIFVVGPNLPYGGANPEDIQSAVVTDDPDSFVRVNVNSGRWNYKWDTSTASGTPDVGHYRVYAASKPVGLSDISSADHSMTAINIVRPYVTAKADGGMISAKSGVVSGTADKNSDNTLPGTEPESGAASVSITENISESDSAGVDNAEGAGAVVEENRAAVPSSSEKSGLPAEIPILATGILFLVLSALRKTG